MSRWSSLPRPASLSSLSSVSLSVSLSRSAAAARRSAQSLRGRGGAPALSWRPLCSSSGGVSVTRLKSRPTTPNDTFCLVPLLDTDGVSRDLHYLDSHSIGNCNGEVAANGDRIRRNAEPSTNGNQTRAEKDKNTLVILCGTAQSIPTWSLHTRQFSKTRRVLIPELRAQGRTTSLLVENCTLAQHVLDLKQFLDKVLHADSTEQKSCEEQQKVDIVGFSLGGRIGLSFAEAYPDLVQNVSVTGVPHQRPYLGQLILRSWLQGLQDPKDYQRTCWSFFESGVSPKFLERNQRSMRLMVNDVMKANDVNRLRTILEKALTSGALGMSGNDPDQGVSVSHGRLRLHCHSQVIASEEDRLAGNGSEKRLADVIDKYHSVEGVHCRFDKILNCGHLAPFERPGEWRKLVIDFLDSSDT